MNKLLFGICIDESLYEEFEGRSYSLAGEAATLHDVEMAAALKGDSDRKAAALEVIELIKKEIREKYSQGSGKKEYKAMKHGDFAGYLGDVRKIETAATEARQTLNDAIEKARQKWREDSKTPGATDDWLTLRKAEYLEKEGTYKKGLDDLLKDTKDKISKVGAEFEADLRNFYFPNGARLNNDIVQLFNSGIILEKSELEIMAEEYRSNPTMLRLICGYAGSKKVSSEHIKMLERCARKAGEEERKIFNGFKDRVIRVVGGNDITFKVESRHSERYFEDAVAEMKNLPITPEG
jgi:hypothetical protein